MKKLLLLLLLLVTVLTLAVPTPALAWGGWSTRTGFVAGAQVAVVSGGEVTPTYIGTNYIIQNTTGEQVYGDIVFCNAWPQIVGLHIFLQHQSRTLLNLNTGKITGTATGTITLLDAFNQPVMAGNYSAFIRGSFTMVEGQPVIYDRIFDAAAFSLSGVPGTDFAANTASGIGIANLTWQFVPQFGTETLAGPLVLTGTYK